MQTLSHWIGGERLDVINLASAEEIGRVPWPIPRQWRVPSTRPGRRPTAGQALPVIARRAML